jgi:aminomethyltransferase
LLAQKDHLQRKMVGLVLEEKGIMRAHQRVVLNNLPDGVITSGGYAPSLNYSIALARVPIEAADVAEVEIRDRLHRARIQKPRFLPNK